MSNLINDNDTLKKYVPNTLKAVAGEQSLFDKIHPQLQKSELYLTKRFLSEETKTNLITVATDDPLLHYCRMATVADTMLSTVPQLDLILTPNGFGIVSNQNVVPASKERIERLTRSLERLRDDAFVIILLMLPNAHKWTESEQYASFAATMFPNFEIVNQLGYTEHIWQHYLEIQARLKAIEHHLESYYFSHELMTTLRTANILNRWESTHAPVQYKRIYQRIAAIEFSVLRIDEYPMLSIMDTVNIIRTAKGSIFNEWKASETAKLFENHGYKNKKQSSGYFF